MAALQISSVVLRCDGCNKALNDGEAFGNTTEARAAAYGAGWRFPSMLTSSGKPAQRGSDVCPSCLPTWMPVPIAARPSYQRQDGTTR
jgi:hypothetical protein